MVLSFQVLVLKNSKRCLKHIADLASQFAEKRSCHGLLKSIDTPCRQLNPGRSHGVFRTEYIVYNVNNRKEMHCDRKTQARQWPEEAEA